MMTASGPRESHRNKMVVVLEIVTIPGMKTLQGMMTILQIVMNFDQE